MSSRFSHSFRVRYGQCDPQGIVFNADMVVAELNAEFRAPARFDELVTLGIGVERLGTTSMTSRLWLHRDEDLLVEGRMRHVVVDAKSWKKTGIPAWLREGLEPYSDV